MILASTHRLCLGSRPRSGLLGCAVAVLLTTPLAACAWQAPTQHSAQSREKAAIPASQRTLRRAPERFRNARRIEQVRLQPRVMPLADRYHPAIASTAVGSISVGTVTEGYLARGVEMQQDGPHHSILEKVRRRQTRFTSDEMRDLLLCVAERVAAKHPDHKLFLGNLSRRGGGDIPWSVSHNNGRDADIAFLARTPQGRAATPGHLYHFNRQLEATDSPEPMVFDVAANWTMIKALLQCPMPAKPQKLFIANWLRYPLLRYARAARESNDIRYAAAALLRQPRRTSPHSDHLHLRIACGADDLSEGCLDRGRAPAEAIGQSKAVRKRLPAIRRALAAKSPEVRAGAAYLAGLYFDKLASRRLAKLLRDETPNVRVRAVASLVHMRAAEHIGAVDAALGRETDTAAAMAMINALAGFGAVESLARRLRDSRTVVYRDDQRPTALRHLVLQVLAESRSLAVAHAVVPLLADREPAVRAEAQRTLERLVNRTTSDLVLSSQMLAGGEGSGASIPLRPSDMVSVWQRFVATIGIQKSRDEVVLEGFRSRGLPINSIDRGELDPLAIALAWEPPYRDNAARLITRAIDYRPEIGRGSRAHPRAFWMPFLSRRRMIDPEAVAQGLLSLESRVAGQMSLLSPVPSHARTWNRGHTHD